MDARAIRALSSFNAKIIEDINATNYVGQKHDVPLRNLFSNPKDIVSFRKETSVVERAAQGDRTARQAIKQEILKLITTKYKVSESDIDRILEGYYINYYGTPRDISAVKSDLLISKLNIILLPRDADLELKYQKFVQVIYQDCFGLGILDEFLDLGIDAKFNKVEELIMGGPNQVGVVISGNKFKFDKIVYPIKEIEKVVIRLSKNSKIALSEAHDKIETELLDQSRVTLLCPPIASDYSFNLRLHYAQALSREKKIELGSSTEEFETFWDIIMKYKPRGVVFGPQGSGKSTDIRDLCARYPSNTSIVTAETSYEIALDKTKHLWVRKLRLGVTDEEDFMETLFRLAADCLILGEARSPVDVMMYTQMAKRQAFGIWSTWHSSDVEEGLFDMANNLVRGGFFKTEESALRELCRSVEIVSVKDVMDASTPYEGRRYPKEVSEICGIEIADDGAIKIIKNVLFEYDMKEYKLKKVNGITPALAKKYSKRYNNEFLLEALKNAEY